MVLRRATRADVALLPGGRAVAAGEGGIWTSRDDGRSWEQTAAVDDVVLGVAVGDERTLLATGAGGVVLRSGDAGDSWAPVPGPWADGDLGRVQLDG